MVQDRFDYVKNTERDFCSTKKAQNYTEHPSPRLLIFPSTILIPAKQIALHLTNQPKHK